MTFKFFGNFLFAATMLTACGGGGGGGIGGTGSSDMGTLHVVMTDAPACGYDAVNISVDRIRVHQSGSAVDADTGWSDIVLSPARRINLLSLANGVLEDLGQTALPAGTYTQMRLVLAANDAGHPLANSVVPSGGGETALTTPSAQQSGIKLNVNIEVAADKVAGVVLDFDACKSVVKRGASGQYNLKPVIAVRPLLSDAGLRVVGYVDPLIALGSTTVSVQVGGVPVKSTVPDATGQFTLYPVPTGSYDLVVTAAGRVTAVMTGVPVVSTARTQVNTAALGFLPPVASSRAVSGSVTPATATVRALQALTGGPTIEVAWGPVNADTGAFDFALPIAAPVRAAYAANPSTIVFTADTGAAGKYTLEAASAGATKTQAIDAAAAVPPITFTFP